MSLKSAIIIDKLKNHIKNLDKNAKTFDGRIQINLKANDIVVKTINLDLYELTVTEDILADNSTTITISDDDFYSVGTRKTTLVELQKEGKIDVIGDIELLEKLDEKINKK